MWLLHNTGCDAVIPIGARVDDGVAAREDAVAEDFSYPDSVVTLATVATKRAYRPRHRRPAARIRGQR